mmetsp:Transcript_3064/g.7102  ORF Transcript_3064/g.7102 Transcript_3064/m.7102 type:complete len:224 (-) Transcript_3064:260-931(-)
MLQINRPLYGDNSPVRMCAKAGRWNSRISPWSSIMASTLIAPSFTPSEMSVFKAAGDVAAPVLLGSTSYIVRSTVPSVMSWASVLANSRRVRATPGGGPGAGAGAPGGAFMTMTNRRGFRAEALLLNSIQFLRSIEYSCRFYAAAFLRWTSVQSQIKARVSCRQPLHVAQDSSRSRIVAPAARFAHRLRYDPKLSHIGLHRDKADVGSYWVFTRNAPSSFHQN